MHGPDPSLLADLQDKYSKNKSDKLALFALSYAGFKATNCIGSLGMNPGSDDAFMLFDSLSKKKVSLPHTCETARTVFLCNIVWVHEIPLQTLGERLLKHTPNDPEVKFFTADALVFSDSPGDRELGAKYVDQILKEEPNDPRNYILKYDQSFKLANINHSIQDLKDCITDWQCYQAAEPRNSPDSFECDVEVGSFNDLIEKWSKGK